MGGVRIDLAPIARHIARGKAESRNAPQRENYSDSVTIGRQGSESVLEKAGRAVRSFIEFVIFVLKGEFPDTAPTRTRSETPTEEDPAPVSVEPYEASDAPISDMTEEDIPQERIYRDPVCPVLEEVYHALTYISWEWPVEGHMELSDTFHPHSGNRVHEGIDIPAPRGTPVGSACFGRVVAAYDGEGAMPGFTGYGKFVVVEHSIPWSGGTLFVRILYAHLDSVNVNVGDFVEAGETIGNVGNTGRSRGNHLHFEARYQWVPYPDAEYPASNQFTNDYEWIPIDPERILSEPMNRENVA